VSLHAHRPFAPRGERTRRLVDRLEEDWEVEIVAPPPSVSTGGASGRSGGSNAPRRLAAAAVDRVLLNKWEPWSVKRLRRWQPDADAALLIGHPVSPLVYASARLLVAGIPYVVDEGDPWAITNPAPYSKGLSLSRARRAEPRLWGGAAGGVLTTPQQADRLTALFPALPTLVRPNGYDPLPGPPPPARAPDPSELRIAHFGMLSSYRLDIRPLLQRLGDSKIWTRVVFAQFGDDFAGMLDDSPTGVEIERNPSYPWEQVVERAAEYDLALVVGNLNPDQLPSKAVQYLTLPVPRLALTEGSSGDALAAYVGDKPGWLAISPDDSDAARRVERHLGRDWTEESLRASPQEAWPAVADTVAAFLERCTSRQGAGSR
jgi:hypothetical protein